MQEMRKSKRVATQIPVLIYKEGKDEPFEGEIRNLSEGGAFIKCSERFELGDSLALEIRSAEITKIQSTVVPNKGIAVPLVPLSPTSNKSVIRWLTEAQSDGFGVEFKRIDPELQVFIQSAMQFFEELGTW